MKNLFYKIVILFIACFSLNGSFAVAAPVQPAPTVTLSWDYPSDQLSTNLTFKIYHSTDMSIPVSNWAVLTNVVGTNLSAKIPMAPTAQFFAITASNASGESGFATVTP